jgi:hypothetical protein
LEWAKTGRAKDKDKKGGEKIRLRELVSNAACFAGWLGCSRRDEGHRDFSIITGSGSIESK